MTWKERAEQDYAKDEHRRCHECNKQFTLDEVLAHQVMVVQGFTGRLFCVEKCWDDYLKGAGLA